MNDQLPQIYARYLDALVTSELPPEPRANCADCAMCDRQLAQRLMFEPFDPASKCCTFAPDLTNFSVGELLLAGGEGARRLAGSIEARRGATPLGVVHGAAQQHAHTSDAAASFGHDQQLRCPYLDVEAGRCTVWAQRSPVCATWFCRHERGQLAADFWQQLKLLLRELGDAIAMHCVLALAPELVESLTHPDGRPRSLARGELGGWIDANAQLDANAHARVWGRFADDPSAFYLACAQLVRTLDDAALRELAGARVRVLEQRVASSLAAMRSQALPGRLQLAKLDRFAIDAGPAGDVLIRRLRIYDPLATTPATMRAITSVDGPAETPLWLDALAQSGGESMLRALVDHGVVEAASDDPPAPTPAPLEPSDRLFVSDSDPLEVETDWDAHGRAVVRLRAGALEISFDEPELLEFGRQLGRWCGGFVAGDATGWTRAAQPLAWDQVATMLEQLLDKGVLVRV